MNFFVIYSCFPICCKVPVGTFPRPACIWGTFSYYCLATVLLLACNRLATGAADLILIHSVSLLDPRLTFGGSDGHKYPYAQSLAVYLAPAMCIQTWSERSGVVWRLLKGCFVGNNPDAVFGKKPLFLAFVLFSYTMYTPSIHYLYTVSIAWRYHFSFFWAVKTAKMSKSCLFSGWNS